MRCLRTASASGNHGGPACYSASPLASTSVIAGWLKSKRAERERWIEDAKARSAPNWPAPASLAGVRAALSTSTASGGRYSARDLAFEAGDGRTASGIQVETVAECYAALGIVHSLWTHIPGEFDDYIATGRRNDHRSLHTAVIGPGAPLEVQIRTREMREHAELGRGAPAVRKAPARRVRLPAEDQLAATAARNRRARAGSPTCSMDCRPRSRIASAALSPKGEVVDLPRGATPLDYAYQVHTDLGHRCRGAKVNGRMASLTQLLSRTATPSRSSPANNRTEP